MLLFTHFNRDNYVYPSMGLAGVSILGYFLYHDCYFWFTASLDEINKHFIIILRALGEMILLLFLTIISIFGFISRY